MNDLHIYPFPSLAQPGPARTCGTRKMDTLLCSEADISAASFSISFEQLVRRLQKLERLFIELDGSFVWSGDSYGRAWQIEGMLYDSQDRVKRIELTGDCPAQAWKRLLDCLDWPQQPLLAHWIQWQCFEAITEPFQLTQAVWENCRSDA